MKYFLSLTLSLIIVTSAIGDSTSRQLHDWDYSGNGPLYNLFVQDNFRPYIAMFAVAYRPMSQKPLSSEGPTELSRLRQVFPYIMEVRDVSDIESGILGEFLKCGREIKHLEFVTEHEAQMEWINEPKHLMVLFISKGEESGPFTVYFDTEFMSGSIMMNRFTETEAFKEWFKKYFPIVFEHK